MAPSSRHMSRSASQHVNLHCLQCDNQIGIFDNEWIRLTSSYVRPVHPGTHLGTEIATSKTQVVPEGVTQRALEGCTLAEVFCTRCSAVVGQYCKAVPATARRNMLNQYLYKLSRTCLKSSESNQPVDPVFGYGGDAIRATAKPNTTLRGGLIGTPQCSDTPFHREETPPRLQPMAESSWGTSSRVSLQNSREIPQDSIVLQLAMQDAHLKSQGGRIANQEARALEHDAQLRAISSVLDTFRDTLEEIKISIGELKSQTYVPRLDKPTQIDFVGTLHKMISTMKTAQSNAQELEELRAENAAFKAKWDIVQSAMNTATRQPSSGSLYEISHGNTLGKRKRDSDVLKLSAMVPSDGAMQDRSQYSEDFSSSAQMPTPQSSSHSDRQSAHDSNSSRTSTPEQGQARLNSHKMPQCSNEHAIKDNMLPTMVPSRRNLRNRLPSDHSRDIETSSSVVRSTPVENVGAVAKATGMISDVQETQGLPTSELGQASLRSSARADDCEESVLAERATGSMNDEAQPPEDEDANSLDDSGQLPDNNGEPPMDIDPVDASELQSSMRETDEFGDDDRDRSSNFHTLADRATAKNMAASLEASSADEGSTQSAPAGRTRSKTKVQQSSRRKPDFITDRRSIAPEPAALRRILPRRIGAHQRPQFEHATPESIEQDLRNSGKPKGQRRLKPHIQTTTKILHNELKELGLEDWIEKDKDTPEYKKAVEEARSRKREQTRLATLASRGISLPGASTDDEQPESGPTLEEAFDQAAEALADANDEQSESAPSLKESFVQATEALVDVDNGQAGGTLVLSASWAAARKAKGIGLRKTKREQRAEEIRRRDLLAKAAMDMND
ncbi:uncharacterized protein Z519_01188 [Cladophialophora bantiana CBS 173.52]|uniref:Yippee domain-containing protein n=1 Tax=Cladophialophora bantiana (strain ATCC 10958 / CBS 173.52 / CDC B-1940 / NIH 8579) TaxID=1442370 RepID=A0A0D2ILD6_CLAB1|nr:uncharacterized protein Z519_01188 [Cladophialophora bantiana CBS 173.52]KIW97604.1 hypothetical protein Z519_01188 [Cladophialophora bantiana CBS 173.52]